MLENDFCNLHHCTFSTYLYRYKGMNNTCYLKRNPTDLTFFLINKGRLRLFTRTEKKVGFMSLATSNICNSN